MRELKPFEGTLVVRVDTGRIGLRVFFCTDPTLSVVALLEQYGRRWTIEVSFRNLKQLFGFADSSARSRNAVERTAPFVDCMYSLLILWFYDHAHGTSMAAPPVRPWYPHKRGVSFADILRTAQRALADVEVLDLVKPCKDLRDTQRLVAHPVATARRRAARVAA